MQNIFRKMARNYFLFQPPYRYFTTLANDITVTGWISKELSYSVITLPATSDHSLNPQLNYTNDKIRLRFIIGCLMYEKMTYSHKKILYFYIVYELKLG